MTGHRNIGFWSQVVAGPALALLLVAAIQGGAISSIWAYDVALVAVYGIVVLSVSLLAGWSGVWSIGHPAVFAVGAYTAAYGSAHGWPLEVVVITAMALSAVCGAFLGYAGARFSILYISLLTLAFNLVVLEVIGRWASVTGGDQGVPVTTLKSALGLGTLEGGGNGAIAGAVIAFGVTMSIAVRLRRSALRMRLVAVKSHPTVSRSIGIAPELQTALAFAVSAAFTGLAGVFLGAMTGFVSPDSFSLSFAVAVIAAAVLGGIGSVAGAVAGGAFMSLAPLLAQWIGISQPILQGAILILVLLFLPQGAVPAVLSLLRAAVGRRLPAQSHGVAGSPGVSPDVPLPGAALEIGNLTVRFGGLTALRDVTLAVRPGEVLGIIGPNGAGKTTLINALSGLYSGGRVTGDIRYAGRDLLRVRATARRRLGVARAFQHAELFAELTIVENLLCARRLANRSARLAAADLLHRVGLADVAHRYPHELPFGLQKRADIARAIAEGASVIVLGESFGGLDENERSMIAAQIRELKERGATIVIVDHVLDDLFSVSERVVAFDFGAPIAEGPPKAVLHDERVRSSYLGGAEPAGLSAPAPTDGGTPMLTLREVGHRYDGVTALRGVDLEITTGTVVGVVGANGAGKSTLGRIAGGALQPTYGDCTTHLVDGRDLRRSLVPEGRQLFKSLTIKENLEAAAYGAGLRGRALREHLTEAEEWLPQRLRDRLTASAGALSGGEQQIVAIARGLVARPDVLILDEPALGLAPALVDEVYARITDLAAGGRTVVLLEQLLGRALSVCHEVVVLRDGKVVAVGAPADAGFTSTAEEAYFGAGSRVLSTET